MTSRADWRFLARVRCAFLLFLKYPTPGRVKTRLAATLGAEEAAEVYRRLVAHVCGQLPADREVVVFFDPPEERPAVQRWLAPLLGPGFTLRPQVAGDLGRRLSAAFDEVLAGEGGGAVVVGTDCVELTPEILREAERALDRTDMAIGPTFDGGYYLMGLKTPQPRLFQEIEWSTDRTLAQTLERAREAGLTVHALPTCHDVDDEEDWRRAQKWLKDSR